MEKKEPEKIEGRVCPQCERLQPHYIVQMKEENMKYEMRWVEEICTVCGAKRVITSPYRKYIG